MSDIDEINDLFLRHYAEFSNQNSLMTLIPGDISKINFILYIAGKAFDTIDSSSSRFEPNPINYFPKLYNETITKDEIKVFFDFIKNDSGIHVSIRNGLINGLKTTDNELCDYLSTITSIGWKFVYLLYFIIFTNSISFQKEKVNGIPEDLKLRVFSVSHSTVKEQEFYDIPGETKILVHGTNIANLYSMMRNGVRSMSNSKKYMTNGAVYGSGIYLTDSIHTAAIYGQEKIHPIGTNIKDFDTKIENASCILYFNVKNVNPKNKGWCYVQQDNEIILRCILWYDKADTNLSSSYNSDNPNNSGVFGIVYKYAQDIKYIPVITKVIDNSSISNMSSDILRFPENSAEPQNSQRVIELPRFKKEIERFLNLVNSGNDNTFKKANFANPSDQTTPLLVSIMPSEDTELYNDLIKYNIPGILVAIYFPSGSEKIYEYPNVPFNMRVISPVLIDGTGRVTKGGSICADQLYQKGWSPVCTVESVIRNFADTVGREGAREGPGRVDEHRLHKFYTYEDYRFSYEQIAGFHGWQSINK